MQQSKKYNTLPKTPTLIRPSLPTGSDPCDIDQRCKILYLCKPTFYVIEVLNEFDMMKECKL